MNSTHFRTHFGICAYSSVFHQVYYYIKLLHLPETSTLQAAGYKQAVEKWDSDSDSDESDDEDLAL